MDAHRSLRIALILLSILGIAVSSYLAYAYLTDTPVRCSATGIFSGCKDVQDSEFAQFLGIPIPIFGLAFYLLVLADAAALTRWHARSYAWRSLIWFITLGGFLFSLYLTFIEAFVLEAWCIWCVASGVLSTAIFLVASVRFRREHENVGGHL